jgi:hypothetical protein
VNDHLPRHACDFGHGCVPFDEAAGFIDERNAVHGLIDQTAGKSARDVRAGQYQGVEGNDFLEQLLGEGMSIVLAEKRTLDLREGSMSFGFGGGKPLTRRLPGRS